MDDVHGVPDLAAFTPPSSDAPIDWALAYAKAGMAVFPCNTKKKPLTEHGFKDATVAPETIRAWWTRWPHAEIGWAIPEALVVVDLDEKDGRHGVRDFLGLTGIGPDDFPAPCAASPTGGRHLFFSAGGRMFANGAKINGLGIDIRASGKGYVCLPAPGSGRRWIRTFGDCGPPPAPGWVPEGADSRAEARAPAPQFARHTLDARLRSIVRRVEGAVEGERNCVVFWASCRLAEPVRDGLLDGAWAADLLLLAARRAGLPGNEARRTIASGLKTA